MRTSCEKVIPPDSKQNNCHDTASKRNRGNTPYLNLTGYKHTIKMIKPIQLLDRLYHLLAGVKGFEPLEWRSQSPLPYRLAIPQCLIFRLACFLNSKIYYISENLICQYIFYNFSKIIHNKKKEKS